MTFGSTGRADPTRRQVLVVDAGLYNLDDTTGKIDDARFYNRALSQEEIAALAGRTEPFAKPF